MSSNQPIQSFMINIINLTAKSKERLKELAKGTEWGFVVSWTNETTVQFRFNCYEEHELATIKDVVWFLTTESFQVTVTDITAK